MTFRRSILPLAFAVIVPIMLPGTTSGAAPVAGLAAANDALSEAARTGDWDAVKALLAKGLRGDRVNIRLTKNERETLLLAPRSPTAI